MRRIFGLIAIVIGCGLVMCLATGLFLMISPGRSVFGIKYITKNRDAWTDQKIYHDTMVSGNMLLFAGDVPITVEYGTHTNFEFHFVQKYNGFTRTKIDAPKLEISEDDEGNLIVQAKEFQKFVFGHSNSGYSLTISLPTIYSGKIFSISANKSSVNFSSASNAVANIKSLIISTQGKIELGNQIIVQEALVIQHTKASVLLGENVQLHGNVAFSKVTSSLEIKGEIAGDFSFKGAGGPVTFKKANSVEIQTTGGAVKCTDSVIGNALIKTTNGSITIPHVGGNLEVTTKRGNVLVGDKEDQVSVGGKLNISTSQGKIVLAGIIPTSEEIKLKSITGQINVNTSVKKINISSRSGAVNMKSAEIVVVETNISKVNIDKVLSSADIKTQRGSVSLAAGGIPKNVEVKIVSERGDISVSNLGGKTFLKTKGKIDAAFTDMNNKIEIEGTDKNITVIVPDSLTVPPLFYDIYSSKKSAVIKITGLDREGKKLSNYENQPTETQKFLIKITSRYGKIVLTSVTKNK